MSKEYTWLTYCPHDGWEEYDTEEEARDALDGIVEFLQDEASEGWVDGACQARLVRAEVVAQLVLKETATAEDDSPEGERCRINGWSALSEGTIEEVSSGERTAE